jgi:ribosomal protein S12 methylthiotransferase accessory factor
MLSPAPWPDVDRHGAWTSVVLDWVDAQYGPVTRTHGTRLAHPEPAFWLFGAELARTPIGNWFSEGGGTGAAGTSIDADEALIRCLGEIAERYSAMTMPIAGELRPVDPEFIARLPRCAPDENCPPTFRGEIPDSPVTHVPMTRLADGARIEIPAGYVHLGFQARGEPLLTTPISTGLAFDPSLETAIWRGLCEVAERDAMMLTWWQRRPAPEIDMGLRSDSRAADLPAQLVDRLERLDAVCLRANFFDITTDFGVPTVFCVLNGEDFPYRIVGACCRDDLGAACTKALDEAVAVRQVVRGPEPFMPPSLQDFNWVTQLDEHAQIYAHGHLADAFDFLLDSDTAPVSFTDAAAGPGPRQPCSSKDLPTLARDLNGIGLTVLWADVTAPELDGTGKVVKVVVPEMVPLSQLHSARWLATRRLARPGDDAELVAASFNRFPHPFA